MKTREEINYYFSERGLREFLDHIGSRSYGCSTMREEINVKITFEKPEKKITISESEFEKAFEKVQGHYRDLRLELFGGAE